LVERFGPDVGDSGYLPVMANRVFGHISGNPVGTTYVNREAAADARVHRPNQGGIWGGKDAESIVVSGGYVDDQDYGDVIIYTGQGVEGSARARGGD
jgi:putative restriction endonuclease